MAELSNSETIYLSTLRPSGEAVGSLLASETSFAARAEWNRMSDDKGSLVVILLDNGGTVTATPRRVTLPTGRVLKLYAKADTSDEAQAVVAGPFTASGTTAADYAFTATLDLTIDSALWNDAGKLSLSVAFTVEDATTGLNPSSYPATLVLTRSPLGEGTPSNTTVFLRKALNLSELASPSAARTNIGGTTAGQAIFTLANPGAISWIRINADNTVTALSAADTNTALGLGTASNVTHASLTTSGNVTVGTGTANIALTPTTLTQTSAGGVPVLQVTSAGLVASHGGFAATGNGTNQNVTTTKASIVGTDEDGIITFSISSTTGIATLTSVKALDTSGATLKDSAGGTVFTWGVTATNDTFARPVTFQDDVTVEGEVRASTGQFTGTTSLLLGTAGSAVGKIGFNNATSGTTTLQPATGALGTGTVTLPLTGTLATLAGTETLTNKTLTSPTLTTPALGTPASGNLANCTGLTVAGGGTGATSAAAARRNLGLTSCSKIWIETQFSAVATSGSVNTNTWQNGNVANQVLGSTAGIGRFIPAFQNGTPGYFPAGSTGQHYMDWTKPWSLVIRGAWRVITSGSGTQGRWTFIVGNPVISPTPGAGHNLDTKGVAIRMNQNGASADLLISCHNGTTEVPSTAFAVSTLYSFTHEIELQWTPAVGFDLYLDGTLRCSQTTGLPTGESIANAHLIGWFFENTVAGSSSATTGYTQSIFLWRSGN